VSWVDLPLIYKVLLFMQEWNKKDFNFQKHVYGKSFHTMRFEAIFVKK
jgi:hypothetical protein